MRRTFKFRIYPNEKQKIYLFITLDICRWIYNKTIELRKKAWQDEKERMSFFSTGYYITDWRRERPYISTVHSQCLRDAQLRVDRAFKAFFRRVKAKEKPGYPRFKSYERYDSFTYTKSGFKIIGDRLKLSKIGSVKIRKHREIDGIVKTLTIRRTNNKWYACFSCEVQPNILPEVDSIVGIDVGLTSFATFSDGEKIVNPRFFRNDEVELVKAQRRLSKQEKGTIARKKAKKIVSRIHEKIANRRSDFAHKLSRKLINQYQVICFEKLDIKNMINNHTNVYGNKLNKSIGDVAWNQFIQYTTYKAEEAGRTVILVNPRNTSKMCSQCGKMVEKELSDRVHSCSCGLVLDRDHNASLNILALGMQSLGKT